MLVCAMFVSIKKWRGLSSSWVDVLSALMRCAAVSSSCYQTSHSRPCYGPGFLWQVSLCRGLFGPLCCKSCVFFMVALTRLHVRGFRWAESLCRSLGVLPAVPA